MGSQLLLRWDNHLPSFASSMKECLDDGELTDVTISCQGRVLHCHKLVLSVASPHFKNLLKANPGQHPIIIMRDIPYADISALLTFIYQGEVTVSEEDLPSFLKTAKALEVRGLADDIKESRRNSTSHLEPEVVVKEEPCEEDDVMSTSHGSRPPMVTLHHSSPILRDAFSSTGVEVSPASGNPKSVSPCVVRLQKVDGADGDGQEGGPAGAAPGSAPMMSLAQRRAETLDPAGAHFQEMLIPGTSALLDRILRRQLTMSDRGFFCPYCTREVNMRTLGKHITKIHGGMRLQCKACREIVHTRVTSLLIHHGVCVLLMNKNPKLGDHLVRKLSRQIRTIYKNRRFKSQMLRRYPDLSFFCSSFIFGRIKQPCARCGLVLWSSSMASHLEKCGEDVVQCDFCNKHMARTRVPYHVDIYHPGKVIHQKSLKPATSSPPPAAPGVLRSNGGVLGSALIVSCPKCNKKMRQNNLRRHMRVMHPWRAGIRSSTAAVVVTDAGAHVAAELADVVRDSEPHSDPEADEETAALSETDAEPAEAPEPDQAPESEPELEPELTPEPEDSGALNLPLGQSSALTPEAEKYAAYKRTCPVCLKTMWKKYLASHIRSTHPEYEIGPELASQLESTKPAPTSSGTKPKITKHCPYCWKTMWRCNIKRHIRVMHPEQSYKLGPLFDLEAEIRQAARDRGLPVPSDPPSGAEDQDTDEGPPLLQPEGAPELSAEDEAMLAIQEMNAMAEAEGLEALEAEDQAEEEKPAEPEPVASLEEAVMESETVPFHSRRHEKNLKRCRYCRKLLRGCHLKRHILNWHGPHSTGKVSLKTGVPGGLNPARQRTCPVCMKIVVVNNLRRHIRASHPEVSEEELANVTDSSYTGLSDECSNQGSPLPSQQQQVAAELLDDTSGSSRSAPAASSSSSYASRRMRTCPHCGKIMVSSNMARHIKTNHADEWRATHGLPGPDPTAADAAAAAAEEMEAMNAEEAAAWLDFNAEEEEQLLDEAGDDADGDEELDGAEVEEMDGEEAGPADTDGSGSEAEPADMEAETEGTDPLATDDP